MLSIQLINCCMQLFFLLRHVSHWLPVQVRTPVVYFSDYFKMLRFSFRRSQQSINQLSDGEKNLLDEQVLLPKKKKERRGGGLQQAYHVQCSESLSIWEGLMSAYRHFYWRSTTQTRTV